MVNEAETQPHHRKKYPYLTMAPKGSRPQKTRGGFSPNSSKQTQRLRTNCGSDLGVFTRWTGDTRSSPGREMASRKMAKERPAF
ncbi:hypothetical protein C0J52_02797 [Blattella germanica]|nr:hypothetical protein C0J52_02797 [Blattella germanica]